MRKKNEPKEYIAKKEEEKKMTHTPPVRDMSLSGVTNL